MMNPEIKAKWVNALRVDPQYLQDPDGGRLKTNNGYCCLGVLCDLYVKEKGIEWHKLDDGKFSLDGMYDFLPPAVVEWAGVVNLNPYVTLYECDEEPEGKTLAELNDDKYSFDSLADLIEAQL